MFGSLLIDPIRAAIFAAAHLLGGSLGAGILTVSFLLRVVLLPLTLRLARRANAQQRLLGSIKPELAAVKERYAKQPDALWRETQALYRRVGYRPFDPPVVLGSFVRLPLIGGLYGALRNLGVVRAFAWIPDLARPNAAAALLVSLLSGTAAYLGSHAATGGGRMPAVTALLVTTLGVFFLWHLSSAVVLSWGASSAVDLVQGMLLSRQRRTLLARPS